MLRSSLALVLLLLVAGCDTTAETAGTTLPEAMTLAAGDAELTFEGAVTYTEVEGGAWILRDGEGQAYEPTNLPESYQVEGLRVRVEADVLEDMASFLMVGPIVELKRIAPLGR